MALTPGGLAVAGAEGLVAGGIPGAIQSVALLAVQNFVTASRSPRVVSFPPGHPKEPLQAPYWLVMRQFQVALGTIAVEEKFGDLVPAERRRIPRLAQDVRRIGGNIIQQIFNQATVAQIQSVIGLSSEEVARRRAALEGSGDLTIQANGGAQMVENIVTGEEQGPAMIDRGRINEGLGNELVTQPQARAIAPIVVPVVEMSRYIPHTRIFGDQVQRSNTVIGPGPVADQTLITIVGEPNKQIFIRSVQVDVSPRLTGGTPQWRMRARSVVPGLTGTVLGHFFVERNDSLMTRGESVFSRIMPSFTVPEGFDYIILFELFQRDVRVALNIDGIIIPVGVNGSKC